jgi:hypothetical protein
MKKLSLFSCFALINISICLLFNLSELKAQKDVLDKYTGADIYDCTSSAAIEILFNFDGCGTDSSVVLTNVTGFRWVDSAPADKQYRFCAANTKSPCLTPATNDGELQIKFKYNGSFIGVKKVNFTIYNTIGGTVTITAYQGAVPTVIPGIVVAGGRKYICDSSTPFDWIKVVSTYNSLYDPATQNFVLDLLNIPTQTAIPSAPAVGTITQPTCLTATGSVALGNLPSSGNWTVTASPGGSTITGTGTTGTISGLPANTYTFTVTNDAGCTSPNSTGALINLQPPVPATPSISAGGPTTFCSGGSVTLTSSPATSYLWSTGATTQSINATTTENYTVQVTNASGCQSASSSPTPVTVNGLPSTPIITPGGPTTFCSGGSVTLTSSPSTSYLWSTGATTQSINATTTGNYTVQVTNSAGCLSALSTGIPVTVNSVVPGVSPEIICLFDLSWSMNRDFYDVNTVDPNAVKLTQAKNALIAFLDLLYTFNPCSSSLGLARFPESPQTGCDADKMNILQPLDATFHNTLLTNIPLMVADGNSTPLLAGIDYAQTMFGTGTAKKVMVLLSDGRQNCPTTAITSAMTDPIVNAMNTAGIDLYTIGFGAASLIPNDILNSMATATGGIHYDISTFSDKSPVYNPAAPDVWNPETALHSAYTNILVNGLGLSSSVDPLDIINKGTIKHFEVPVTSFDEKVCFIVSWVTPQENYLELKLYTPLGNELSLTQPGIVSFHRKNHTIISLPDAILNQPGMRGIWKVDIDGSNMNNTSEHYQYSVINSSKKLDIKTWFEKEKYYTGDKMKIFLQLLVDGKPLTGVSKTFIKGTAPAISLGNWLASKKINEPMLEKGRQVQLSEYLNWLSRQPATEKMSKEEKQTYIKSQSQIFLKNIDPIQLRAQVLKDEFKLEYPKRIIVKGLRFNDDGKNGDLKASDGIYTATYIPSVEGSYNFNISANSAGNGQLFQRESQLQKYVRARIRVNSFIKTIKTSEEGVKGKKTYDIILRIRDAYGNIPILSGLGNVVISADKGNLTGELIDNGDGTFLQKISVPENIDPEDVRITLSVDEMSGSQKLSSGSPFLVVVIVIAALSIIVAVIARIRKRVKA